MDLTYYEEIKYNFIEETNECNICYEFILAPAVRRGEDGGSRQSMARLGSARLQPRAGRRQQ